MEISPTPQLYWTDNDRPKSISVGGFVWRSTSKNADLISVLMAVVIERKSETLQRPALAFS